MTERQNRKLIRVACSKIGTFIACTNKYYSLCYEGSRPPPGPYCLRACTCLLNRYMGRGVAVPSLGPAASAVAGGGQTL